MNLDVAPPLSTIGRGQMPRRCLRPKFRAAHNDVADGVFHVVVSLDVGGGMPRQCRLDLSVSRRDVAVGAKVIAKEQRVSLIGATHPADVQVDWPLLRSRLEEPLLPLVATPGRFRRDVVSDDVRQPVVARTVQAGPSGCLTRAAGLRRP